MVSYNRPTQKCAWLWSRGKILHGFHYLQVKIWKMLTCFRSHLCEMWLNTPVLWWTQRFVWGRKGSSIKWGYVKKTSHSPSKPTGQKNWTYQSVLQNAMCGRNQTLHVGHLRMLFWKLELFIYSVWFVSFVFPFMCTDSLNPSSLSVQSACFRSSSVQMPFQPVESSKKKPHEWLMLIVSTSVPNTSSRQCSMTPNSPKIADRRVGEYQS